MIESCARQHIDRGFAHPTRCLLFAVLDNPIRHISPRSTGACGPLRAHQMGSVEQKRARQLATLATIDHALDAKVFSNILDLDDDEDQNFSRSLVFDFIDLAKTTLDEMDACL